MEKTRQEVLEMTGLTRKQLLLCEEIGEDGFSISIPPTKKNKYGAWIYEDVQIKRLWIVVFYLNTGLKLREIKDELKKSTYDEKNVLEKQILALKAKKQETENLLSIAEYFRDNDASLEDLDELIPLNFGINAKDALLLFGNLFDVTLYEEMDEAKFDELLSEDDVESIYETLLSFKECYSRNLDYDNPELIRIIEKLRYTFSKVYSNSILMFSYLIPFFHPNHLIGKDISDEMNKETSNYIYNALKHYVSNIECDIEQDSFLLNISNAFDEVLKLAFKKFKYSSKDVQEQVGYMYDGFNSVPIIKVVGADKIMKKMAESINTPLFRKIYQIGNKKDFMWFLSNAIKVFCNNLRINEKVKERE